MYQGHLEKALKAIFPNDNILVNTKKQTGIKHKNEPSSYLELDLWIPTLNLGFEFQDAHHYVTTWYYHNSQETSQKLDHIKQEVTRNRGITLFVVPCWWDGTVESLIASIHFQRPDLLALGPVDPIALNIPSGFFRATDIPSVGELMQASFPTTGNNILVQGNNWWMGEKYDGIRCCWHPEQGVAYTRTRTELSLTSSITMGVPHIFIDGEFWFGRGLYGNTYALFKSPSHLIRWDHVKLISFDSPSREFDNVPFESRYSSLLTYIAPNHPYVIVATRVMCESEEHLQWFVRGILDEAGEGIILRKVGSLYEHGRSTNLLKLKSAEEDTEGIVLSKEPKSIQLKLPSGSICSVPSQNVHVAVQVGDVVTFSFDSNSRRDAPTNVTVYKIRTDLDWDDVVLNYAKEKRHLSEQSRIQNFTQNSKGYWTTQAMRAYMINFAKKRNLNPFRPHTWYQITYEQLNKFKGGRAILQKFKGYIHALRGLFPDMKFDASIIKNSWQNEGNRRKFFEEYAKSKGFDPLIAESWYKIKFSDIKALKGADGIIEYHRKSMARALLELFPDIGLDKSRWQTASWATEKSRRQFFVDYAKQKGFDPLIPQNWYSESIPWSNDLNNIRMRHNNSTGQALKDLFPEIGLDPTKVKVVKFWNVKENRRNFFETYARERGFDPLVAENWRKQNREDILATKGATRVLFYHENKLTKALKDLFPELERTRLSSWSEKNWSESSSRRRYFENYAKENGFDPLNPEGWYSQSIPNMLAAKNMSRVISYYGHNLTTALLEIFPNIGLQKHKMWRSPRHLKL